jgi:flagellar hook-associated protein 3 FlgL
MTRISENQSTRILINNTLDNKRKVAEYADELSSGYKVVLPGDSNQSGTVSQYRQTLDKIATFTTTVAQSKSFLQLQDDTINEVNDILVRVKEIASQAANETNSPESRDQLSAEIFQIRDHLASLANSTFQGRYIWGGAADNIPPYVALTYTNPPTGEASQRYVIDAQPGRSTTRSVQITDNLNLTVNSAAAGIFDNAIQATERIGRALAGYATTLTAGVPDGGGTAYTFPTDFSLQTQAIKDGIQQLDIAREGDVIPERVTIGGKLRRIDTAESLLNLEKTSAEEVLARIQNTDETESAAGLQLAQNALQASYTVTARVLRLSIIDYI